MKKSLLAFALLLTSLSNFAAVVELLRAESTVGSKYGMVWQNAKFLIKAERVTSEQKIQVVFEDKIIEAKYIRALDENFSLWSADRSFSNNINNQLTEEQPRDLRFYVQSISQDGIDRDNNSGNNFFLKQDAGTMLSANLNVIVGDANLYAFNDGVEFTGVINVKNLAYGKRVKVVYSTDNWQTVKEIDARFEKNYSYGYTNVVSPNENGIENWTFRVSIPERINSVEFAVVYQVEGAEFWDNNFGQNYRVTKKN